MKKPNWFIVVLTAVSFLMAFAVVLNMLTELDRFVVSTNYHGQPSKLTNEYYAVRASAMIRAFVAGSGISCIVFMAVRSVPRWMHLVLTGIVAIMLVEIILLWEQLHRFLRLW